MRGYISYLALDKIGGYFYDMGDLMGVTTYRRTFLDRQIEIGEAPDHDTLWQHTMSALELLKMDRAEMRIDGRLWVMGAAVKSQEGAATGGGNENTCQGRIADAAVGDGGKENAGQGMTVDTAAEDGVLAMRLPLVEGKGKRNYGTLYLEKDIVRDPLAPFTLRRIEHLRRSLVAALKRLEGKS
jgi:UDP-GlcNAc:undecaprenyl-phosphate GlcNAc-1-phosphate transferase